jgi:hypothetical protein
MTCEDFRDRYQFLVDARTQHNLPEDLARHYADCETCNRFARAMSAVDGALRNLPEDLMSETLLEQLLTIPQREMERVLSPKNYIFKGATLIIGGVALLGVGTLLPSELQFWPNLILLTTGYTILIASILKYKRLSVNYE